MFCISICQLLYYEMTTVETITEVNKVPINEMDYPGLLFICQSPAFNMTALQENGYLGIYEYYTGQR